MTNPSPELSVTNLSPELSVTNLSHELSVTLTNLSHELRVTNPSPELSETNQSPSVNCQSHKMCQQVRLVSHRHREELSELGVVTKCDEPPCWSEVPYLIRLCVVTIGDINSVVS